jgi:LytS/YehU family sensor histidine kinase
MLFETKPERIPLQKELTYIEEYIDLQRLRASHPNDVSYTVQGDVSHVHVPPMLFIPFIENAFTHSEAFKSEPAISIQVDVDPGRLHFICQNKFSAFQNNAKSVGGLGLSLMEKRLNLLYPQKHTLKIDKTLGSYSVHLVLETL